MPKMMMARTTPINRAADSPLFTASTLGRQLSYFDALLVSIGAESLPTKPESLPTKPESSPVRGRTGPPDDGFPRHARYCRKCSARALIVMDGCETCLNCGDSKCGV